MPEIASIIMIVVGIINIILLMIVIAKQKKSNNNEAFKSLQNTFSIMQKNISENQNNLMINMNNSIMREQRLFNENIANNQNNLELLLKERMVNLDKQFERFTIQNNESMENIRMVVEKNLTSIQKDNNIQLEKMRETVDEKLQSTLENRITQSFKLVNERLQEVYLGLGEMKTLANGVGDLKKVLSNVKTRGIMGEIQLGAIIKELLTSEQYEENFVTKKSTRNPVEYAIKLPGKDGMPVYLPVDAKFPLDTYEHLLDAYESGDKDMVKKASESLKQRIKGEAKDIYEKYIDPPNTTDFAIMFLPMEGLYAEVIKLGILEELQRKYKINISGPTTFAALLNSLQMGFKTLSIQKRSSEVWQVLGAVKTEFNKFEDVLNKTQDRIRQTSDELDKLVGVRTRQINRKLKQVEELPKEEISNMLEKE